MDTRCGRIPIFGAVVYLINCSVISFSAELSVMFCNMILIDLQRKLFYRYCVHINANFLSAEFSEPAGILLFVGENVARKLNGSLRLSNFYCLKFRPLGDFCLLEIGLKYSRFFYHIKCKNYN